MDSLYKDARSPGSVPCIYFAFVEKVDFFGEQDNHVHVWFDCIREKNAHTPSESLSSDSLLSKIRFIHIECFATKEKWARIFRQQIETREDSWMLVENLAKKTDGIGIIANEFYNGEAQELIHNIVLCNPDKGQILTIKRLTQKFDFKKNKLASEVKWIAYSYGRSNRRGHETSNRFDGGQRYISSHSMGVCSMEISLNLLTYVKGWQRKIGLPAMTGCVPQLPGHSSQPLVTSLETFPYRVFL